MSDWNHDFSIRHYWNCLRYEQTIFKRLIASWRQILITSIFKTFVSREPKRNWRGICRVQRMKIRKFRPKMTRSICLTPQRIVSYQWQGILCHTTKVQSRLQTKKKLPNMRWKLLKRKKKNKCFFSRFSGEVDIREWCVGFRCEVFF